MKIYTMSSKEFVQGVRFWKIKTFKTKEAMDKWVEKNSSKYQIEEVFVNNAFAVEYRKLLKL